MAAATAGRRAPSPGPAPFPPGRRPRPCPIHLPGHLSSARPPLARRARLDFPAPTFSPVILHPRMSSPYLVALIRPPKIVGALERHMVQHPINLLSLAAAARAAGFAVEVWDFEVEPFSEARVRERARASRPDLIGITGMTCNVQMAHRVAG